MNKKITNYTNEIAAKAFDAFQKNYENYFKGYSQEDIEKCQEDFEYHTLFLLNSIALNSKALFLDYCKWVRDLFLNLAIPIDSVVESLNLIAETIREIIGEDVGKVAEEYVEQGIEELKKASEMQEAYIYPLKNYLEEYINLIFAGKRHEAFKMIVNLISNGTDIKDIYNFIFREALYKVGLLWQFGKISVAHEHFFTASTQLIMSQLYPYIFSKAVPKNGIVVVGACVSGELHEIGLRMVCDLLELEGFDTHYLGANTPASGIVKYAYEKNAKSILLSATITFHLEKLKEMIEEIRSEPRMKDVKIIVGGRPFTIDKELYKTVGADATASDVSELKNLLLY
ncbi:cobalamin-dependent protein [Fervidobacterium sp.]